MKVAEWKIQEVKDLEKFLANKKVVGIVDLHSLPSAQLQEIRKKLRGRAEIKVANSLLIKKAIENLADENLKKLEKYIKGPAGILVSNENPFSLYKFLKKNRSKAPAKPGSTATADIIVPEGATNLPVGPVLSEFKTAKIDVKIDKGKIVIASDSLIARKGEKITLPTASALSKLGITPIEIGLQVNALLEKDIIYEPSVLDIDEKKFMQNLKNAYLNALNLSITACYPNKESITFLIQKASRNALNLALNASIITKQTVKNILVKASMNANVLLNILSKKGF